MGTLKAIGIASLAALAGCGLENMFSNSYHEDYPRPASALDGASPGGATAAAYTALDGDGATISPFLVNVDKAKGTYDMHLPSSKYSMIRARFHAGNMELRTIVPQIGEESLITGVDLDAAGVTEALIVESWLSANGKKFKQLTPDVYAGTSRQIRAAIGQSGPVQTLYKMVQRIMTAYQPDIAQADAYFFGVPVLDAGYKVKTSPLGDGGWLGRVNLDYSGDGINDHDTLAFDAALAAAAPLFVPTGCLDPNNLRVVFTVDFNQGALTGNGGPSDRFKWAKDAPGKKMYFVGWIHKESPIQDPAINNLVGASTPNNLVMYDDGTNGDETAGDGIWTIAFNLPKGNPPGTVLRLGYKYTWGFRGAPWTGSEEWPGNSRILEVVDVNGDGFVYRRDVFGDEATNKDNSNLSVSPKNTGSITWSTDLRGCGYPESHEQPWVEHTAAACGTVWFKPQALGPINVACN